MSSIETIRLESTKAGQILSGIGYIPIVILPTSVLACRGLLPPWMFMWGLCFAIFAGLKWLTWWKARGRVAHAPWRSVAYLLAWPGMDAEAFLGQSLAAPVVPHPTPSVQASVSECGDSSPLSPAATRCGDIPTAEESAVDTPPG